jgi:hypothetical protein
MIQQFKLGAYINAPQPLSDPFHLKPYELRNPYWISTRTEAFISFLFHPTPPRLCLTTRLDMHNISWTRIPYRSTGGPADYTWPKKYFNEI